MLPKTWPCRKCNAHAVKNSTDIESYSAKDYDALLSRNAALEADLTTLADEVKRRDTYWNREKHQYEDPMLTCPARVRELLAARAKRKEEG